PVLAQVKLTERETQGGVAPDALGGFLDALKPFDRLQVQGLMAIAPNLDPVEAVRPFFRTMSGLFERFFKRQGILSIGMSRDFEIAIEEGSTMIRVGSSLFS